MVIDGDLKTFTEAVTAYDASAAAAIAAELAHVELAAGYGATVSQAIACDGHLRPVPAIVENSEEACRACGGAGLLTADSAQSLRDRRGVGWCLQTIAMSEAAAGRAQRAAWLYSAGQTTLDSIGAAGQAVVTQVQDYLAPARQTLGDAALRDAANEGGATPMARIMDMDPGAFASA